MENFESIDDFLSNRLSDADKEAFGKLAAADPSLKANLNSQQQIIDAIRNARRLELKSMLNNVPVGGMSSGAAVAGKIAAGIVAAGIIGSVVYFSLSHSGTHDTATDPVTTTEKKNEIVADKTTVSSDTAARVSAAKASSEKKNEPASTQKKENTAKKNLPAADIKPATSGKQPKIEVVDPSADMENSTSSSSQRKSSTTAKTSGAASVITVDTDATNKNYNFHYQFAGGKLMLYGPFDKSLYDILEINGEQKSVFLFYKGDYYLLSDKQNSITRLEPIKDPVLVKKLKEYKGQ